MTVLFLSLFRLYSTATAKVAVPNSARIIIEENSGTAEAGSCEVAVSFRFTVCVLLQSLFSMGSNGFLCSHRWIETGQGRLELDRAFEFGSSGLFVLGLESQ